MLSKRILTTILVIACLVVTVPGFAQAYYKEILSPSSPYGPPSEPIVVTPLAPPVEQTVACGPAGVRHIGSGKGAKTGSTGMGVPLDIAANLIVPSTWRVTIVQNLRPMLVTWDAANRDWTVALDELARKYAFCAAVDWSAQRVMIQSADPVGAPGLVPLPPRETVPAAPTPTPAPAPAPVITPPATAAAISELQAKEAAPPVITALPQPIPYQGASWSIAPGALSAQLQSWCAAEGYQLIWKVRHDFNMSAHAVFHGTFREALRDLFKGLERSGHRLRVTVHEGNRVVEVVEE